MSMNQPQAIAMSAACQQAMQDVIVADTRLITTEIHTFRKQGWLCRLPKAQRCLSMKLPLRQSYISRHAHLSATRACTEALKSGVVCTIGNH